VFASGSVYMYDGMRTAGRAAWIREAAERTLEIDPESPDAQLAMGIYLYRVPRDFEGALDWLDKAAGTLRGEFQYQTYRSVVERRMGRWPESLASLQAAITLSPGLPSVRREMVVTLLNMRRYDEAEDMIRALIGEQPENPQFHYYHFHVIRNRGGDPKSQGATMERYADPYRGWEYAMAIGDPQAALLFLEKAPDARSNAYLWHPRSLPAAMAWEEMGEGDRAADAYREAVSVLEPRVAESPDDERYHAALGQAYAGLGRREDAVREARAATEILPLERDALSGPFHLFTLAGVLAGFGEVEEAVEILERLLTVPSRYSAPMLRTHHLLRSLWHEPAFLDLLEREPGRVF
jgi:tetratricopeptide (TPR) repeat protein